MRTAFIGGGVMGEAMLARALVAGVMTPADVCVAEPLEDRRAYLAATHGVAVTADGAEAAASAELVVLAVKPQQVAAVLETLAGTLDAKQTALSIVAGVPLKALVEGLKHPHVVRVMPNTPARIGAGMSVWTAAPGVSASGRANAHGGKDNVTAMVLEIQSVAPWTDAAAEDTAQEVEADSGEVATGSDETTSELAEEDGADAEAPARRGGLVGLINRLR